MDSGSPCLPANPVGTSTVIAPSGCSHLGGNATASFINDSMVCFCLGDTAMLISFLCCSRRAEMRPIKNDA